MSVTTLFCSCLSLVLLQPVCAGVPEPPAEAEAALAQVQRLYASGLANHGEVLAAERELLACRMAAGSAVADLLPLADSLCRRSEEYLARCLEGGVADRLSMNGELIRCLSLKLELERRAGLSRGETRARLRALYEANVVVYERRFRSGQAHAAELEAARRALADFLATE